MKQTPDDPILVVRLDRTDWRVTDRGGTLLGYVERQRADRYEVVWMTDPLRWGYTDSFETAIAAFRDSVRFETSDSRMQDASSVAPLFGARAPRRGTWIKPKGRPHVA